MKKINIKTNEILFLLAYLLYVVCYYCSKFEIITKISNHLTIIVVIILFIVFLSQSKLYNIKKFFLFIFSFILFASSAICCKNNSLLLLLLFVFCTKDIDINRFIKIDLITKISVTFVIIVCCKLNIIPDLIMIRSDGFVRHALGFKHPNTLGKILFFICTEIVYINYKKLNIKSFIIIIISLLLCDKVCDCRAATYSILLLITIYYINKNFTILSHKIISYVPVLFTIISYISVLQYNDHDSNLLQTINNLVSGRISCIAEFFRYYHLNLFGNYFEFLGQWETRGLHLTAFDNSYLFLFLRYGIVVGTIVLINFKNTMNKLILLKNHSAIICILSIMFFCLMESCLFSIESNPFLMFSGLLLYDKNNKKSECK